MKKAVKAIVIIALLALSAGAILAEDTTVRVTPVTGIDAGLTYLQSFKSGEPAPAATVSVPLLDVHPGFGNGFVLNADVLVIQHESRTLLSVGGSATLKGIDTGNITLGLCYVPDNDFQWSGYLKYTAFQF